MKLRWVLGVALCGGAVISTACAPSSGGAKPNINESSSDKVTSVEIDQTPTNNVYDLIYRLRPHWLRAGATGSIGGGTSRNQVTLVYLDGNKLGGIETLRSLSSSGIKRMEWLTASRASVVLSDIGSDPISGAISLHTR